MGRFIARRVLWSLVTILLLATIAFFAVNWLLPYDYSIAATEKPQAAEELRRFLGEDRLLVVRWLDYMGHLARADLWVSFGGEPITSLIWRALPTTVTIFAVGGLIAYLLGEWFGRMVAWSRNRAFGATSSALSVLLFTAFPPWLVFLLVYFGDPTLQRLRVGLGLEPRAYSPVPAGAGHAVLAAGLLIALLAGILLRSWARRRGHRVLAWSAIPLCLAALAGALVASGLGRETLDRLLWPGALVAVVALVLIAFGENLLVMRVGVAGEMHEDYVFTARAKGVPGSAIRDRHVAANAVVPALARLVTSMPYLLAGLIIIEREVKLGGLASVFFQAIEDAETRVIVGVLVVVGLIGLVLRITLDAIQAFLDPRSRVGGRPA